MAATLTAGSGPYTVTGSSVNFNGSGAQTIPVLPTSTAAPYVNQYNILTASGGNTKTVAGAFTLLDSLKIASSTTLAMGANTLTLKSTQTQTARVAKIDGTLNQGTGKFIVERHIPAHRAWRLMTAPIVSGTQTINQAWQEGANTTSANPNPGYGTHITGDNTKNESMGYDISPQLHSSIFAYNTTSGAWDILPATTNGVDATTYPGYMLFVRGSRAINMPTSSPATTPDNAVLRPTAKIKTGSQSAITNGSGGFMTIANPFPSPINFHSLNKSGLVGSDAYYMWDPNLTGSNAVGAFVTFSYNSGTGLYDKSVVTGPGSSLITNTGVIPSGAAIMVNFNAGGSIAVAEKDKCADAGGQPYTFRTMNGQGSLRTTLYAKNNDGTQSVSDGNLITFAASNNNVVDNEDAVKINNFAENFSLAPEGKLISIERRQPVMVNDTIFYKMWKMKQKDYVLELAPDNMADPTLTAYLEDKYTGQRTMVSLTDTSLYPFTINGDAGSIDSSRFRIVFKPAVILPVTITGIHASKQNSAIKVEWNVEQEINMSSYVVERAADGTHFSDMHTTATTGNNSQISFDWLDVHPLAVDNYYRIRCISRSGVITYSPVVKVSFTKGNPAFAIAPNPVKGSTINLQMSNIPDGDYQVQLLNSAGQLVLSRNLHHSGISATMPINAEVPFAAGEYVLHITGPIETNIRVQVTGN